MSYMHDRAAAIDQVDDKLVQQLLPLLLKGISGQDVAPDFHSAACMILVQLAVRTSMRISI